MPFLGASCAVPYTSAAENAAPGVFLGVFMPSIQGFTAPGAIGAACSRLLLRLVPPGCPVHACSVRNFR